MIKMVTAYSYELDNAEEAARDILNQLDVQNKLLKNSVALVFCNMKFVEMGITEVVCKALPFVTLGCSSQYSALSDQESEILLTVAVLTSDDTEFATGISGPIEEHNVEASIRSLYQNTREPLGYTPSDGAPSLAFSFQPMMNTVTPDVITAALDAACEGIPLFGSVALDMDTRIRHPMTIYQGKAYTDRAMLLLFRGPVKPRFFSVLFPEKSSFTQDAVITGAEGNRIISINNEPAVSFLTELGLLRGGADSPTPAIPLVIADSNGMGPKIVIMRGTCPDGSLQCSNYVRQGEILNVGAITADFVLESAAAMAREIYVEGNSSNVLMFSCILRSVILGGDFMAEIGAIRKELRNFPGPWLYQGSGGEICPRRTEDGKTTNRVNQYALIACQL